MVIMIGIFLGGKIWIGNKFMLVGWVGEFVVVGLMEILNELGFEIGRLKMGILVRVDWRLVDYDKLEF